MMMIVCLSLLVVLIVHPVLASEIATSRSTSTSPPPAEDPFSRPLFQAIRRASRYSLKNVQTRVMLWKRQSGNQKKQRKQNISPCLTQPLRQGSVVSVVGWRRSCPSYEDVTRWFWGTSPIQFNHPFFGMTNPFLQIFGSDDDDDDDDGVTSRKHVDNVDARRNNDISSLIMKKIQKPRMRLVSRTTKTISSSLLPIEEQQVSQVQQNLWWPQNPWRAPGGNNSTSPLASSWRVLCFRHRVGYGKECYERVKEAVLDLEFRDDEAGQGILNVFAPDDRRSFFRNEEESTSGSSPSATSLLSYPHEIARPHAKSHSALVIWPGGGRRLASYTRVLGKRSPVFVVSPLSVLYQTVDQPYSDKNGGAGWYSCAAYATQKGHWLSGEGRVTIVLRGRPVEERMTSFWLDHRNANQPDKSDDWCGAVDVEILSLSKAGPSMLGKIAWPFGSRLQHSFFVRHLQFLQNVANNNNNKH